MKAFFCRSQILQALTLFSALFCYGANASASSTSAKPTSVLPLTEIYLKVFVDNKISIGNEAESKEMCEKWLRAFAPSTGPWGYGLAATGECSFDYHSDKTVKEELSHSKIYLYMTKESDEKNSHRFELCWTKLSAIKLKTAENFRESLKCSEALVVPPEVGMTAITGDEAFMKWVAAQLMEASPLFSYRNAALESKQDNKRSTHSKSDSEGFLPTPPEEVLDVEVSFDSETAKFLVKPHSPGNVGTAASANVWLILKARTPARRQAYMNELEKFISRFSSGEKGADRRDSPIFQTGLILSQGLQISSLKSDYAMAVTTTVYLTPHLESQLGFYHRNSRYSLNLSQISEFKKVANSPFVVQFNSSSLDFLPFRFSLPKPNAKSFYVVTVAPIYILDSRENSLTSEVPGENRIGVEGQRHHLVGLESSVGVKILDGLWLKALGSISRDLSDKTTDMSSTLHMTWFNSPSSPREGFYLGLFLTYASIERLLRISFGPSSAQLTTVFNSLHSGFGFGYGH